MQVYAYLSGIGALGGAWLLYGLLTNDWVLVKLIDGHDKRPSTSRFQLLWWTGVVIFGYTTIYVGLAMQGDFEGFTDIPKNVLFALGLSGGTGVVAKTITQAHVESRRIRKPEAETRKLSDLVNDDAGWPDLFKVQMLTWTFIASAIFIAFIAHDLNTLVRMHERPKNLPDIDTALMILMGLGQGAYLGKKLVSTTGPLPQLTAVVPPNAAIGSLITILGAGLGPGGTGDDLLLLNGQSVVPADRWTETSISFTLKPPAGVAWQTNAILDVSVIAGGRASNHLNLGIL